MLKLGSMFESQSKKWLSWRVFLLFSLVPSNKSWESTLRQTVTNSFHIFPCSPLVITLSDANNYPTCIDDLTSGVKASVHVCISDAILCGPSETLWVARAAIFQWHLTLYLFLLNHVPSVDKIKYHKSKLTEIHWKLWSDCTCAEKTEQRWYLRKCNIMGLSTWPVFLQFSLEYINPFPASELIEPVMFVRPPRIRSADA
jgi:hypothetical protein